MIIKVKVKNFYENILKLFNCKLNYVKIKSLKKN